MTNRSPVHPECLIQLSENLSNPISFFCRAGIDEVVSRRQGGETASMMRMVAPHLCSVLYNVCVCTLTEGPSP